MEQTRVELSGLKLLCERNETKKQELESKATIAQEVLDLQDHICATEVQNKKTFQGKEREMNRLHMEIIMVK